MAFSLEIQNFGKLADATIHIGNLTVFAGPNNTGKSYVSKLLYSIFDAMNANHVRIRFDNLSNPINDNLRFLERRGYMNETDPLSSIGNHIDEMSQIVDSCSVGNNEYEGEFFALDQLYPDLKRLANEVKYQYENLRPPLEMRLRREDPDSIVRTILREIREDIDELHIEINEADSLSFLTTGIQYKIQQNLIRNFQTPKIVNLKGHMDSITPINIEGIGNFQIEHEGIHSSIQRTGLLQLQRYSKVIYLESPIHWKLKNALDNIRGNPRFFHSEKETLSGVPGYFYDLASALREQYSGDIEFPELLDTLTKSVLGGKITMSETGELLFQEKDRVFPLILTATGVANLGILALLIERKVLDKGAFLFIDEPEAHLHPDWQVVMAETLFKLARQGANVVIATHSADILKWIEVRTKKHPEDKQLIALNHFTLDGVKSDEEDFEVKLAGIKKSLTEPFLNLHLKGLGL